MGIPMFGVEKVTLIDSSWLVYRAAWAPQAKSISQFTGNAIAGPYVMFLQSVQKIYRDFTNPIFVLDGYPKSKNILFPAYKAQRKEARDADPEGEVKRSTRQCLRNSLVQSLPTVVSYLSDQEADDTIASLAVRLKNCNVEVNILSSDRDLWQLQCPGIKLWIPGESGYKEVTAETVQENFGCPSSKVALFKAILGDSGDNVPKIPRLSSKLAKQLVNASADLEELIVNIQCLPDTEKWKKPLIEFLPQLRVNYQLVKADLGLDPAFAYFRLDPIHLQAILDSFQVRNFSAHELYQTMIPVQDAILYLLSKHGQLNNVLAFDQVFKS